MTRQIGVSLISDQTIPNILAIYHFKPDNLLFVSTEAMEKKGKVSSILKALQRLNLTYELGTSADTIIVQEDSLLDINRKIDYWIQGKEDSDFIVNLTGGTKIMAIAAYEFFKDFGGSKMIYIPIPKNEFITPFPKKSLRQPTPLTLRLGVVEYLTAYGLKVINEKKMGMYSDNAIQRKNVSQWIVDEYENLKGLLSWFRERLKLPLKNKKNNYHLSERYTCLNAQEEKFFAKMFFQNNENVFSKLLTKDEMRYLTGGWLEEYCFNTVHAFSGNGVDDVCIGLQMQGVAGRQNEFDIMFTKDNALYFIEAKSLEQGHDPKVDILYKLGAQQKDFGLRVESFLVTTSPFIIDETTGIIKQHIAARAAQLNTTVVMPTEVRNLKTIIRDKLMIEMSDDDLHE